MITVWPVSPLHASSNHCAGGGALHGQWLGRRLTGDGKRHATAGIGQNFGHMIAQDGNTTYRTFCIFGA
jgi:hypothetical protein